MYKNVHMRLYVPLTIYCKHLRPIHAQTHTHSHTRRREVQTISSRAQYSINTVTLFHRKFFLFVYFVRFILALFCSFRSHRIALKRTHGCVCVRSSLCECGCDVYCYVLLLGHRMCASIFFFHLNIDFYF